MKELIRKIKLHLSNLLRRITVIDVVNSQMNLMLSSQTSGVNWQVKLQMLQEPSNPTYTNQNLAWKQNNSGLINYKMIFSL